MFIRDVYNVLPALKNEPVNEADLNDAVETAYQTERGENTILSVVRYKDCLAVTLLHDQGFVYQEVLEDEYPLRLISDIILEEGIE